MYMYLYHFFIFRKLITMTYYNKHFILNFISLTFSQLFCNIFLSILVITICFYNKFYKNNKNIFICLIINDKMILYFIYFNFALLIAQLKS